MNPRIECTGCKKKHLPKVIAFMAVLSGYQVSLRCGCGAMLAIPPLKVSDIVQNEQRQQPRQYRGFNVRRPA